MTRAQNLGIRGTEPAGYAVTVYISYSLCVVLCCVTYTGTGQVAVLVSASQIVGRGLVARGVLSSRYYLHNMFNSKIN